MQRTLGALTLLLATACSAPPPPPDRRPPPLPESAAADWRYAVRILYLGDVATAHRYLERAIQLGAGSERDGAQVFRDLAEVRLASGDTAGAAAAARVSADALAAQPPNARFTDSERHLFQRTLDALQAAAADDSTALAALSSTDESPPAADACYLLGWTRERHGDMAAARVAYRVYLDRSPAWSFLRTAPSMRQHAQAVVARSP